MNFIRSFDNNSELISFSFENKSKHQTAIGGVLVLLAYVLSFTTFIYFATELWQRNKPRIIQNFSYVEIPDEMSLNGIDFMFLMSNSDIGYRFPTGYYDVHASLYPNN